MMFTIIISLIPLMIYDGNNSLRVIDIVTVCIFCIDYFLRYLTADFKIGKGVFSFFIYPFTFLAIIDLLSIMPSFEVLGSGFKVLKIFRLLRTFRVFRAFKIFRYSKNLFFIFEVIKKQKNALITLGFLQSDTFLFLHWSCSILNLRHFNIVFLTRCIGPQCR